MIETNELSFLPDDYLSKKDRRRAIALAAGIAAIAAIALGGTFLLSRGPINELQRRNADATRAYDNAMHQVEQVSALHERERTVVRRAQIAAATLENIPRSNLLAELTNALPDETSLQSVTLETIARPDTTPAPASAFDMKKTALEAKRKAEANIPPDMPRVDVMLKVTGLADTQDALAQYLCHLIQSPLLKDVKLLVSEIGKEGRDENSPRRFEIQMTLNPTENSASSRDGRQAIAAK